MQVKKQLLNKIGHIFVPAITSFSMALARVCFSLRARNAHFVPKNGGAIIVSNHPTYLDPPLMYVASWLKCKRKIAFMAASWIFQLPIVGPWLPLFGAYSVDKDSGKRNPFLKTLKLLENSELVGLFLEGTVSSGILLNEELKSGAVRASLRLNVPIIPATIIGGFKTWPTFKKWKYPRMKPVEIIFHEPFEPYKISGESEIDIIRKSNEMLRKTINAPLKKYVS